MAVRYEPTNELVQAAGIRILHMRMRSHAQAGVAQLSSRQQPFSSGAQPIHQPWTSMSSTWINLHKVPHTSHQHVRIHKQIYGCRPSLRGVGGAKLGDSPVAQLEVDDEPHHHPHSQPHEHQYLGTNTTSTTTLPAPATFQPHVHCEACDGFLQRQQKMRAERFCCGMVAATFMAAFVCGLLLGVAIVNGRKDKWNH
ncbi:hypothetical protein ASPCAL11346 [Aspergillus calidoustus]|uniref:LITAF domain-containing protein n=1 Tax=Aspergillus calidoustus TaxID=454130 RepID=A0A0U5G9E5_ASPCI|nr:hypothetical protein ASPCAL11346 [Aspergillus calidoustus]